MPAKITIGDWRTRPNMIDYRTERFSDMVVERATWSAGAASQHVGSIVTAAPGYIWFRFWLLARQQIVDKFFDADRRPVGMYAPVTMPFQLAEDELGAVDLLLALWLSEDGRITVLREERFEEAMRSHDIDSQAAVHAEQRIRELTMEVGQGLFPPAMVRNFTLTPA